ncbi:MAG: rRNA adenine N-6-methyltransferase family protein [Candidatus Binatia bacterium]
MLIDSRGRCYIKRLHAGHRITIRGTVILCDDLIGTDEGALTGSGERERFRVLRPTYVELSTQLARPAEPIFAKDAAAILMHADIRAGDTVIEVGVGAGFFTMALLRALGPTGRLTSYELREDLAQVARGNVRDWYGEAPAWSLVVRDAAAGFDERSVDRVTLDVPEPGPVLAPAAEALRSGGSLAVYLPTILQVKELHDRIDAHGAFTEARTLEVLERTWHIEGRSVRPDHRMVAHTAFLTFTRRIC